MRLFIFALLQFFVFFPLASFAAESLKASSSEKIPKTGITEVQKAAVSESYGKLPLYFTENKGQVDRAVRFYEKGAGHAAFFTEDGVVIALTKSGSLEEKNASRNEGPQKEIKDKEFTTEAVKLSFIGANKNAKITASRPLPGHVNYFVGNDKTKWQSNVPTYKTVTYEKVFENIDIKFYGNNRDIEHDIIVAPAATHHS